MKAAVKMALIQMSDAVIYDMGTHFVVKHILIK